MPCRHVRQSDRELTYQMRFYEASLRKIAADTGFSVSTISGELLLNAQEDEKYGACAAEVRAPGPSYANKGEHGPVVQQPTALPIPGLETIAGLVPGADLWSP